MDCNELNSLLTMPENMNLDFKSKDLVGNLNVKGSAGRANARLLLKAIIAFANSFGGKLVIGVDDKSRSIEPDSTTIDEETAQRTITNLVSEFTFPIIPIDIQFLQCPEGTVIVISIQRRSGPLHALTGKVIKESSFSFQIFNRMGESSEPVHYQQLIHHFSNQEFPIINRNLAIGLTYYDHKEDDNESVLKMLWDIRDWNQGYIIVKEFFDNLFSDENSRTIIMGIPTKSDSGNGSDLLNTIIPDIFAYATILFLGNNLEAFWDRKKIKRSTAGSASYRSEGYPSRNYRIEDFLPNIPQNSIFKKMGIKFNASQFSAGKIVLPLDTKVEFQNTEDKKNATILRIYSDNRFELKLSFVIDRWALRPNSDHPLFYLMKKPNFMSASYFDELNEINALFGGYSSVAGTCSIEAKAIIGTEESKEGNFFGWLSRVVNVLQNSFDFLTITKNLDENRLERIESKLDEIIGKLD